MKDTKHPSEIFESSTRKEIVSGSIKFSNRYCSLFQVFEATSEWVEEDKGVIFASVRTDGTDFICLDLRYDENINAGREKYKSFLYDFLKPLFKSKLGDDYLQAWSLARGDAAIIK